MHQTTAASSLPEPNEAHTERSSRQPSAARQRWPAARSLVRRAFGPVRSLPLVLLCAISVLSVSLWLVGLGKVHHRDTENRGCAETSFVVNRALRRGPDRPRSFPCTCCSCPWRSGPVPAQLHPGQHGASTRSH